MQNKTEIKKVTIYADGSCLGNPGPGGWGAVLICNGKEKQLSGGERETTNNRMELTGVIEALGALKEPCVVEVFTDSRYVAEAIDKRWAVRWRENGWKRNSKDPALNPDLWDKLLTLCVTHDVTFKWLKGHAGDEYNEKVDALATAEAKKAANS